MTKNFQTSNQSRSFVIIGEAGTGIFCNNCVCLHRANVPAKGKQRDVVEFLFEPSTTPLPENWIENVPNDSEDDLMREKAQQFKKN